MSKRLDKLLREEQEGQAMCPYCFNFQKPTTDPQSSLDDRTELKEVEQCSVCGKYFAVFYTLKVFIKSYKIGRQK
jgi:hypothetical protein